MVTVNEALKYLKILGYIAYGGMAVAEPLCVCM